MSRGKAWRRSKEATKKVARARVASIRANPKPQQSRVDREKRWKDTVGRSNKVRRGRQLGFDYPRKTQRLLLDEHLGCDQ